MAPVQQAGMESYCQFGHEVPLGFVEGLNNNIRTLQRRANGLRDHESLRLNTLDGVSGRA